MPNSRILGAPFIFWNLGTPYFRLQPKIQKSGSRLLLGLLKGFQNCTSQPHSTKTHKKMPWKWASSGPWEWAFARSRTCCWAPWGQVTNPTLQLLSCFNCENLVKNYSIYAHRETHILPPYGEGKYFFYTEIYTFSLHYVHTFIRQLCSLIHSICER